MHPLYQELILHPPEGWEFNVEKPFFDKAVGIAISIDFLYSFQEKVLGKIVPPNLFKAYLEKRKRIPEGTDLTFSLGHLVFRQEPWVVFYEYVSQLAGYSVRHLKRYKKTIESVLSSDCCKRIIVWNELTKKSTLSNLDGTKFEQKIEIVPIAVRAKDFTKSYNNEKVKILFVGSATIPGQFGIKGGNEYLETIRSLNKKYNNLEFIIRSDIPVDSKKNYGDIDNLRVIDKPVPYPELEYEFQTSDIFLFPANCSPDTVLLDAMSYELPIVTVDAWANPEIVDDGRTGLLVRKSERVQHVTENFIPNWASPANREAFKTADPAVVEQLVEKTSILIENMDLRRGMGKAAREEIESGRFSIKKRNDKLSKIFDEATK